MKVWQQKVIVPIFSRTYLATAISEISKSEGKIIKLRGWIAKKRTLKGKIFLVLRDSTGLVQTITDDKSKAYKTAEKITTESSAFIRGKIVKDPRAPGGYEVKVSDIHIVGLAETWPIARDTSAEFLRDIRHLSLRQRKTQLMLKVRAATFAAYHECMTGLGYMEHQSPSFTPTPGESGAETFEVKYFKDKAYLTQTWQLYAESMLPIMEKIYTVAPSFRADKSMTSRHLTEYWHAEVETAWQEFPELLGLMEYIVKFISEKVAKMCKKELIELGQDPKYFAKLPKFKRLKYRDAITELKKDGFKVKFGDDLGTVEEKHLVAKRKIPMFITHYPTKLKAFYMKIDPKDKSVVFASDLMLPGIGEAIGSAERSTDFKDVKKRLLAAGEDPKVYEWYFDAVSKYGSVPHSGFGLGMERLVMWFTGAESVKDVIAYPRTPTRFAP